jgi:hypothetical protein
MQRTITQMNNTTVSNCARRATYIRVPCVLPKIQEKKHTMCYAFLNVNFVTIISNLAKLAYCLHTIKRMCKLFGWVLLIPKSSLILSPLRSSLHKPPKKPQNFSFFKFLWRCGPTQTLASSFLRFLDHTQRRTIVGRTPLDE